MDQFIVKKDASLFEIYKSGLVRWLMDKGLVSVNRAIYFRYYEVFLEYNKNHKRTESVKLAADECGVTEQTIWTVLKSIEPSKRKSLVKPVI